MIFTDALGRNIELFAPPRRIVSLVPSVTETLFALGLDREIVGITRFCVYPPEKTGGRARVGGTKKLELDKIMALEPELAIANAEENSRDQVEAMMARGLKVFVTFPRSIREAIETIGTLGRLVGRPATELLAEIEADYQSLTAGRRIRPRVLCLIWRRPLMSANCDTFVGNMIESAGGFNVCREFESRYPRLEPEQIIELSPEVMLLPDEPYRFTQRDREEFMKLAVPAARSGRIHIFDGQLITWHGPRLGQGLRLLNGLFYPA